MNPFLKIALLEIGIKKNLVETDNALALAAKRVRPDLYAAYPVARKQDKEVGRALGSMQMGSTPKTDTDQMLAVTAKEREGSGHEEYLGKYKEALKVFAPYKDWYTSEGHDAINRHFKTPVTHYGHFVAGLLAAQSPQMRTDMNLKNALEAADSFIMGRPLVQHSVSSSPIENSIRAAHGGTNLSGMKVHSFDHNLKGDYDYTTVDSHFIAALNNKFEPVTSPEEYHKATMLNRKMSSDIGWSPADTQAAGWAFNKSRVGGNHPWFHEKGSPFHHYSELAGGHLPVTDKLQPSVSFGSFMDANAPTMKWFTDRWDKKISSDPIEAARVKDTHYTHMNFLRANDVPDSVIQKPSRRNRFVHTLLGGGVLPGQSITNHLGEPISTTTKQFDPALQKEVNKVMKEGIKICNSIRMAYLLEHIINNFDSPEVKNLLESADRLNDQMRLLS